MGSTVRFQIFGPVRAWRDDVELDLGPHRQVVLLGLLVAAAGQALNATDLVDALWPTNPVDTAMNAIHRHVGLLRRLFEPELPLRAPGSLLLPVGSGYRLLVEENSSDLVAFRAATTRAHHASTAEAAVDGFLTALAIAAAPVAESLDPVVRAHPMLVAIEQEKAATALQAAEAARSVASTESARALSTILRHMVATHPLHEPLHAALIDMLTRSGQRAAAIDVYHSIRDQLANELGLDPGRELTAAHARILTSQDARPDRAPSGQPVPAQLPTSTPHFIGREAELAQALPAGASGAHHTVLISAIGGMAGVGKTALAVHWAHRIADQYPDGQLYLNLRGFDLAGAIVPTHIALRNVLIALGISPADVPDDLDAAAALYRSRLAGTRTLVVLDNARDAEHVRPLLPGSPGCQVIITSRNRLASLTISEGAHSITLGLLTYGESHALLALRLGSSRLAAEPDATAAIVSSCRGLPLALAIIAARASTNPALSLAAVAAELRQSTGALDALAGDDSRSNLRTVFSWSYQALSPDAADLFRQLATHPGPDISAAAAASLGAQTLTCTRALLTELVAANLVTEPVPGRFVFHDLVRAYATELTEELDSAPERRAALERLLNHYVYTGNTAKSFMRESQIPTLTLPRAEVTVTEFADLEAADAWFAAEQTALLTLMTHLDDKDLDPYVWQLAWVMDDYLIRRGSFTEHIFVLRRALTAVERTGDKQAQAHIYRATGEALSSHGETDRAETALRHAIDLYHDLDDKSVLAHSLRLLSSNLNRQQRHTEALDSLQRALTAYRAADARYGAAVTLNEIGWCHAQLGNFDEALAYCERALPLFRASSSPRARASTLDSLGYIRHHLGHHDEAIINYQQAADYRHAIMDLPSEAATLDRLGDVYHDAGRHQDAHVAWSRALAILDNMTSPYAEKVRVKLIP